MTYRIIYCSICHRELVVKQLEVGKEEGGEALKAIAEGASQFQADVEAGDVDIDTYVGDTA